MKLRDKEYRASFVTSRVRTMLAIQLRVIREQRGLTQSDLASLLGTTQSGISRLENPEYGRLTVTSLLEIATALDVGLIIKFVPHDEFLLTSHDLTPHALEVDSFKDSMLIQSETISTITDVKVVPIFRSHLGYKKISADRAGYDTTERVSSLYAKAG